MNPLLAQYAAIVDGARSDNRHHVFVRYPGGPWRYLRAHKEEMAAANQCAVLRLAGATAFQWQWCGVINREAVSREICRVLQQLNSAENDQ